MDVKDAVKTRRSIHFFDSKKTITDGQIEELISLANLSPSSFNLQPWRVVVVRDPERKRALRKCAFDQQKAEDASCVLIMVADPEAVEENMDDVLTSWETLGYNKPEDREKYVGMIKSLYGEPGSFKRVLFAVKNTSLFAMTVMIAARGLGLETHPMDGFDEEAVKKEFRIPEGMRIPMLIAVGFLKEDAKLRTRAYRRALPAFVGYESYQKKK